MSTSLIDNQIKEGFFIECPITFRDISKAKKVLIERLMAIYHTRVSYPELSKKAKENVEQEKKNEQDNTRTEIDNIADNEQQ